MKFKGEDYRKSVQALNEIRVYDKELYKKKIEETANHFKVSVKTIYRDTKKERDGKIAGLRKTREDSGKFKTKISQTEKQMVTELMKAGKTKQDAVKIASEKTGGKISRRKSDRIRPEASLGGNSLFGSKAKEFIEKLFEFNLIAPDSGIPLNYKGTKFLVSKEALGDIIMILSNAFNQSAGETNKLQLDRKALMKSQIFNLLLYQISLAKISGNIKDIESITRMYQRMEIDYGNISPDLKAVIKVCRVLKPDITEDEVFSLIKKFGD